MIGNIIMKKTIQGLLSLIIFQSCQERDVVTLEVKDPQPIILSKNDSLISVTLEIINPTKKNYLMYGFYNIIDEHTAFDSSFCNAKSFVGVAAIFYDEKFNSIPISLYYKEDELIKKGFEDIRKRNSQNVYLIPKSEYPDLIILKSMTRLLIQRKISLIHNENGYFDLAFTPYYFKIFYYSGDNIYKHVNKEISAKDCIANKAGIFKGCLSTSFIKVQYNR